MALTRLSYWNCLIWGYLRLNNLIFGENLRSRSVGDCGEMWGIVECGAVDWWWGGGKGNHFRLWDGGNGGVCGLRDVQIFTNFDIFKKFLILTFFHHHHFVLKNINHLSKCHKIPSFSLHPAKFPYVDMWHFATKSHRLPYKMSE